MDPFRHAVEASNFDAIPSLLADNVVFTSPIVHSPYPGKGITVAILRHVLEVFDNFRYVREFGSADGRDHALVFETEVAGKKITGCDFLHYDEHGKIDDFMVMVRPLSGTNALAEAMGARFEQIVADAAAFDSAQG